MKSIFCLLWYNLELEEMTDFTDIKFIKYTNNRCITGERNFVQAAQRTPVISKFNLLLTLQHYHRLTVLVSCKNNNKTWQSENKAGYLVCKRPRTLNRRHLWKQKMWFEIKLQSLNLSVFMFQGTTWWGQEDSSWNIKYSVEVGKG